MSDVWGTVLPQLDRQSSERFCPSRGVSNPGQFVPCGEVTLCRSVEIDCSTLPSVTPSRHRSSRSFQRRGDTDEGSDDRKRPSIDAAELSFSNQTDINCFSFTRIDKDYR